MDAAPVNEGRPGPAVSPAPTPDGTETRLAEVSETIVEPRSGWGLVDFREIWAYRELLFFIAWRDIKVRYAQTALGAVWAVLQPVLMMAIFTLFLGRLARVPAGDIPYPLFVYAGLLPWFFFATAVTSASTCLVDSEQLVTKVYFPRLILPLGSTGVALTDFLVAWLFLMVLMAVYGRPPGWGLLLVPGVMLLILLAAVGVGTILGPLNVRYRDVRFVIPFMLQAWMFGTPSIYLAAEQVSGELAPAARLLLLANPLTGLVASFRAAMLGAPIPWGMLGLSSAISAGLFLAGCAFFRREEDSFADVI